MKGQVEVLATSVKLLPLREILLLLSLMYGTHLSAAAAMVGVDADSNGRSSSDTNNNSSDSASMMMMSPMTDFIMSQADCRGTMEVWDVAAWMCRPLPQPGMPMRMVMVHGNAFAAYVSGEGSRGRQEFAAPNMLMVDAGTSVGDTQYINLEMMATAELWTDPTRGYPELLQIGEKDRQGRPFIDAQHPHSSPLMGLTLSDTYSLGRGKDHLRLFAAPRGEATDGPVAFMHRPTGMVNPDAPLGHHVGQDVGHISSSVVGAALQLGKTTLEVSSFHGREPEPTKVDLPLGQLDSLAARLTAAWSPYFSTMVSAAYVQHPEPPGPLSPKFVARYSASAYAVIPTASAWTFYNSLIYGAIRQLDGASLLQSWGEEFLWRGDGPNLWGRYELLQRTADELDVPAGNAQNPDHPQWVSAMTLGYTQTVAKQGALEWGIGGSATRDFLPRPWTPAYRSEALDATGQRLVGGPWSLRIFVQLSGMAMRGA